MVSECWEIEVNLTMANRALTAVNQNVHRQVRRKNQSVFKSKQISVENNVDKFDQKVFEDEKKLSMAAEKVELAEKENTPILLRSKRIAGASLAVKLKADIPVASKTKRSGTKANQNLKTKSKTVLEFTKKDSITVTKDTRDKTQNCSNLSPVTSNRDVFKSSRSGLRQTQPVLFTQNTKGLAVNNEASILTSDTEPLSYWMELPEHMRKSLETAVEENVLLRDERAVFGADISQLKHRIKEAEESAKIDEAFRDEKKLSKAAEKVELAEKENTPILRRSKRKAAAPLAVKLKADLPVASKTKRSDTKASQNRKTKSKTALEFTKKDSITVTKDTRDKTKNCSNLSPVTSKQDVFKSSRSENSNLLINSPLNRSGDSGFGTSTRVSDQSLCQTQPVLLTQSTKGLAVDNEASILTSDTEPLSYSMDLDEMGKSLDTALREIEMLRDQLAVFEAENSQLKQLIKEAEEFAKIVEDILK